ncbi:MAG: BamA/TamA family outer membrane protein [Ferruginibacter sp.]
MIKNTLYYIIVLLAITSCSVRRYLPEGERLYKGAVIKIEREEGVKSSSRYIRKQLELALKPRGSKLFFGRAYKVWWWYVIGEPKHPNGIRAFFRNKLGEPPILSSKVNAKVTAENMQAFLANRGYFHSVVTGDTINQEYFTTALYTAKVFPQYTIKNISWVDDSSALIKLLRTRQQGGILKEGNGYRLSDIEAETDRLDSYVKTMGYYNFRPSYIMAYVDSTIGNNQVDIFLNVKRSAPENAKHAYTINRITVFPNYTLLLPPPDTSTRGTVNVDGLLIRDTVQKFRSTVFKNMITYRPSQMYSSRDQNATLNRLINLGSFKFVKNRFEPVRDSGDAYRLNVFYYITPAKKKSIKTELDGFSKENKFIGSQLSLTWKNRNTFRGAEQLIFKAYGGFEVSFSDSLKATNVFRIGGEASINFPGFYFPYFKIPESNLYPTRTRLLLGYELFRKQLFYTKNVYRLQYEFNWKPTTNQEHILSPVALTYINASNLTDSFRKQTLINPSLQANIYSEVIVGSFYSYIFNTANPFAKNQWYFLGSLDFSGNIAGLISGAKQPRQKKIFNTPFSQYAKADIDIRYKKKLTNNFEWANRLQIGIGIPYNNSNILPFSKQYVIGGSGSLRGFQMRQIGPGSYLPSLADQRYFQVIGGDYRLQLNTEMRMPIFAKLSGVAFVDAGNIWTKDTLLFGKAGKLKKESLNELAIAAGLGLRFDASLILIRIDLGVPIRKPYLPVGQRWVIDKIALGDKDWRQKNLIVNIALGYPF